MAFKKIQQRSNASLESPESLLHDLRAKKIKGALSHQADMWRSYIDSKILNQKDVAFQLPTGSGKTLVGLMIAEWRRRKFQEKVVYLCPTNQLVNQVVQQANNNYGLNVAGFTGRIRDYSQEAKSDYLQSEKIAITSYSALFNTNPFFSDPDVIVLDDAHAAENYISKFWSLEVSRYCHKNLYTTIIHRLKNYISISDYLKLSSDDDSFDDFSWVNKLPTPFLKIISEDIISLIDEYSRNNDLQYTWSLIRDHLHACHLFYSKTSILIRPLIPPTNTHAPFKNAKQRIYMSATLGAGGDLERIVGREKIERLPIPAGWDQQGIGRRFFVFPESSLLPEDSKELFLNIIEKQNRSLFLTTNSQLAEEKIKVIQNSEIDCEIFNAKEIEETKEKFIKSQHAIAIFANRYDGIDFPDDECRLLMIEGLPTATNLQEKFLTSRMGAQVLLNERILTRVIQAIGRCTRSPNDYSAVVIYGEDLFSYLISKDKRKYLHPELQAELEFSIQQSTNVTKKELLKNLDLFLSQSGDWFEADKDIIEMRNGLTEEKLPCVQQLSEAVKDEIKYQYSLWDRDFSSALESANNVLSKIKDQKLRGYRSLWNYLAGSSCLLESQESNIALENRAKEYFKEAKNSVTGITWLVELVRNTKSESNILSNDDCFGIIEKLESNIIELKYKNNDKYNKHEKAILDGLESNNSKLFEESQKQLGNLLGYKSDNSEAIGSPDPWWILRDDLCIVFEDHNEAGENSKLDIEKARQAFCHDNWIRENGLVSENAEIVKVLVTPVTKAHLGTLTHLKNVYVWNLDDYKKWVKNVLIVIRELRTTFPGEGDIFWRSEAAKKYEEQELSPLALVTMIKTKQASDVIIEE